MPFTGITYPEELLVLTKALEDYCREAQIDTSSEAYYDAGRQALTLYQSGIVTSEELTEALRQNVWPSEKRFG